MKRLCVVVEGQTERAFVTNVLRPYLYKNGFHSVDPVLIRTSKTGRGGHSNITHLVDTVRPLLTNKQDEGLVVTTMVDFYKFPTNIHNYKQCMSLPYHHQQADALENEMGEMIQDRRFVPYVQLHEFETLLFSSGDGFEHIFGNDLEDTKKLLKIVNDFDNPEDINNTPEGAPSKRILSIRPEYEKVLEGEQIIKSIGLETILSRCPRFAKWVDTLVSLAEAD